MSSASQIETDARYRYACDVARAAASRAYSWYQQRHQRVFEHKRDLQDVVSEAACNVGQLIKSLIAERFPEDTVLDEANGGDISSARFIWVVESVDGKASFLNGLHHWCVSLAVLCDGEAVIGVVCDPNHQELFHACSGQGAWVNERRIQAHSAQHLRDGVFGLSSSSRTPPEDVTELMLALMKQGGMFICIDSGALTSAWAAAGRLTGYYEAYSRPRDSLPGIVLMREAGGIASDYRRNGDT